MEALKYKISVGNGPGDAPNGTPPSRAEPYGIAIPISAATVAWSYYVKKRRPNSRRWLLTPIIAGAIELSAAAYRFESAK